VSGARPFVIGWLTLLLLLGLSVGSAYLAIGGVLHAVANFGIAATQAAIIFILFMKLRGQPSIKWVFAAAGFFWLIFMFGLGGIDYATRSGFPFH
jgi:caa(3)-type oxidase subunit IV